MYSTAPPELAPPEKVLESVDGDLCVDAVEQSPQQTPHCPHGNEHQNVVGIPQPALILMETIGHTQVHVLYLYIHKYMYCTCTCMYTCTCTYTCIVLLHTVMTYCMGIQTCTCTHVVHVLYM